MFPNCPRCASSNTKFCYYNNYSLSQPRFFCKGCRRYWTKGGSLRNVPVGGGCRKNRRGRVARLPCHRHHHTTTTSNDSMVQLQSDGSDIDLALVFANFLNPNNAGSGSESELGGEAIQVSNSVDQEDDMSSMYYSQQIQSLLVDELVQDALWSPPHQTQLQHLDLLQSGPHNSTMNLTADSWTALDFSAFEVFPTP